MAEQELNGADVGALFQQVNREGMTQRMWGDGFRNLTNMVGYLALALNRASCDVPAREVTWKEPVLGLLDSPPGTQDLQELRREHHVAIFFPFALLDTDDHALAVDCGRGERDGLGDAQSCGIADGQDGAMFSAPDAVQKLKNFFRAQDHGQFLRLLRSGNHLFQGPIPFERDLIQKTECRNRDENGTGGQFLFVRQIDMIGADLLWSQQFG